MKRLMLIIPYYSIESWLFQNTDVAIRLCREKHSGKDVDVFEGWAANRAKLDEEIKPKEMVCLRAKHNRELATTGFPFDLAHELKKSLKAAVDELSNSHDLRQALRRLSAA